MGNVVLNIVQQLTKPRPREHRIGILYGMVVLNVTGWMAWHQEALVQKVFVTL